jgi:hypothetical protein
MEFNIHSIYLGRIFRASNFDRSGAPNLGDARGVQVQLYQRGDTINVWGMEKLKDCGTPGTYV